MLGENPRCSVPDEGMELNNLVANMEESWLAIDDVKGTPLNPKLVQDARDKELRYLSQMGVYSYASTAEAVQRSGKKPLRLKWVDTRGIGFTFYPIPPRGYRSSASRGRSHFRAGAALGLITAYPFESGCQIGC